MLSTESEIIAVDATRLVTRTPITDAEPVFAGHYPGFPILPGVLLVDAAHRDVVRSAAAWSDRPIRLVGLDSVRFSAPVFPGDVLETECAVAFVEGGLHVKATFRTGRGRVAGARLRFALEAS
jgi:3-hydroxyacyl-[acyl-carrier-protein] dehydratase